MLSGGSGFFSAWYIGVLRKRMREPNNNENGYNHRRCEKKRSLKSIKVAFVSEIWLVHTVFYYRVTKPYLVSLEKPDNAAFSKHPEKPEAKFFGQILSKYLT
ncbi:hypothetical protein NPIL_498561 [Nephila pilipes]|uniref:Uncharacterized protein n=1 Tax=Nephila pilipes TaxID=299642 RepID=A0A8X6TCN4_NEPPI|nr:hypothetical protein NPIL_498561 [Nephila pilipes]